MNESPGHSIRIATRASRLAMWQANHVADLLRQSDLTCDVKIIDVSTLGDRDKTQSLTTLGGTGVFTREIQKAVLDGRADIAVHSLKDLPTEPVEGLILAAVPQRESVFDVLVLPRSNRETAVNTPENGSVEHDELTMLALQASVGTGSPRRRAQLLHLRQDLRFIEIRGNVETRLRKLDGGACDALVLAEAGLRRLQLQTRIDLELSPPQFFPAAGQGALGIECRADHDELVARLARISSDRDFECATAERSLLAQLRAGCHAPLGMTTQFSTDRLQLEAVVLSADGRQRLVAAETAESGHAESLGVQVAEKLRVQGADLLINATP